MLTIDQVNMQISQLYKPNMALTVKKLDKHFKKSPAVLKNINKVRNILKSENVSNIKISKIIEKMNAFLVPPGTKASIRGNIFNNFISSNIKKKLKQSKYSHLNLHIEKKHPNFHEKPDWIITSNKNCKMLVGYNQLDFWNGGAQINRASKYILDDNLHKVLSKKRLKLVSVIMRRPPTIKCENHKLFKIFEVGFRKQRLFYLSNLENIIEHWFL